MCTRGECQRHVGQWIRFRTPYGVHKGVVERVTADSAIILSPRQYVPVQLASSDIGEDELQKLDIGLATYGRGFVTAGYPGYGGGHAGPRGYGGWGYGWRRWAVSFLIIYALWGLLLW